MNCLRSRSFPRKWISNALLVMPFLVIPDFAAGQGKGISTLEEALKDIKPASSMCPRDDSLPGTREPPGKPPAFPDLSCAVAPSEALAFASKPGAVVVDTRHPKEFSEFRIDGALNIRVGELRVKSFLVGKSVLLVGNGKGERELYLACGELKRFGFKQVKVLRGGMPAWLAQGQLVIGPAESTASPNMLNASQLWAESRFDANQLFLLPEMAAFQREFATGKLIQDGDLESIKSFLDKGGRNRKALPVASVVLIAGSGMGQERIEKLALALKPIPLLVYADAPNSLRQYLSSQEAVWKAQARGPKQPKCGL